MIEYGSFMHNHFLNMIVFCLWVSFSPTLVRNKEELRHWHPRLFVQYWLFHILNKSEVNHNLQLNRVLIVRSEEKYQFLRIRKLRWFSPFFDLTKSRLSTVSTEINFDLKIYTLLTILCRQSEKKTDFYSNYGVVPHEVHLFFPV